MLFRKTGRAGKQRAIMLNKNTEEAGNV